MSTKVCDDIDEDAAQPPASYLTNQNKFRSLKFSYCGLNNYWDDSLTHKQVPATQDWWEEMKRHYHLVSLKH